MTVAPALSVAEWYECCPCILAGSISASVNWGCRACEFSGLHALFGIDIWIGLETQYHNRERVVDFLIKSILFFVNCT